MNLTPKQEKFCQEYVKSGNMSEAYRIAYNTINMKQETINKRSSELYHDGDIRGRVNEIREIMKKKDLYTLEQSIQKDIRIVEVYEDALSVIQNMNADEDELEVARRTIKAISNYGFSSAQDRLAKKLGFYENDNKQKFPSIIRHIDLGSGEKPNDE